MLKIGLTGNIASGKTQVEKMLIHSGYQVFDLDKISHDILENNEKVKDRVLQEFSTLNRKELAKIVFSDKKKKKTLEDIIHPELKKFVLELFRGQNEVIFVSGALLYEAYFDKIFDKIIFVDADFDLRLERLKKRNNIDKKEALAIMKNQDAKYRENADFIIKNNTTLDDLRDNLSKIMNTLELNFE